MKIDELEWDDENIDHIARHDINPQEVEDVCFGIHISRKEKDRRYILSGQSNVGRYLNVVIELVWKGIFRPITAFEMGENYKREIQEKVKEVG